MFAHTLREANKPFCSQPFKSVKAYSNPQIFYFIQTCITNIIILAIEISLLYFKNNKPFKRFAIYSETFYREIG